MDSKAIITEVLASDILDRWIDSWVVAVSPLLPLPAVLTEELARQSGRSVYVWDPRQSTKLPTREDILIVEEAEGLEEVGTYQMLVNLLETAEEDRPFTLLWGTHLRPLFGKPSSLSLASYVRLTRPTTTDQPGKTALDVIRSLQSTSDEPIVVAVPEASEEWPEFDPHHVEPVSWIGPDTMVPVWWRPPILIVIDQRLGLAPTSSGGYEPGYVRRNRDRWTYRAQRLLIWAEAGDASTEVAPIGWRAEVAQAVGENADWLATILGPMPTDAVPTPLGAEPYQWLTAWLAAGGDADTGSLLALILDGGRSALVVPSLGEGERWEAYDIRRRHLLAPWGLPDGDPILRQLDAWNQRNNPEQKGRATLAQDVLRTWDLRYRGWQMQAPPDRVDLEAAQKVIDTLLRAGQDLATTTYLR